MTERTAGSLVVAVMLLTGARIAAPPPLVL